MAERPNASTVREEDIRPAALMREKEACIEWDREFLLGRRDRWIEVACPGCGARDHRPHGEKNGFAYVECVQCAMVYTNPRPSQALVHEFYAASRNYDFWNRHIYPATEDARRRSIIVPRVDRTLAYCRSAGIAAGTLLEVGAAFGTFCDEIRSRGYFGRVLAVEPTPALANRCRQRGIETIDQPIELIGQRAIADVLVAFEVIEHLFHPRSFLEQCARLLRPNGALILSCPNVAGFDVATLGMLSGSFDHEHMNYFHPSALTALLRACGFDSIEVATPGKLDVELVRKQALAGRLDLSSQPFLEQVICRGSEEAREKFQVFLSEHRLSSHMWAMARLAR